MKYSFMTFSCPELTLDEALAVARKYGYDGIEPRVSADHKHGIEYDANAAQRAEVRKKAADSGIALCCIATSCRYADPALVEQSVADTRRAIDLAADLDIPVIRVFGGMVPDGMEREEAVARVSGALSSVADYAQARRVTVCVETHDSWCDPDDLAEVIRIVNQPSIAVNWDIMHPVRVANKTIGESFEALKPWIRHIHCHDGVTVDGKSELRPIGKGDIDHRRAIELLKSLPYNGFISGEWISWEPYEVHLPRELAKLKEYEAETS